MPVVALVDVTEATGVDVTLVPLVVDCVVTGVAVAVVGDTVVAVVDETVLPVVVAGVASGVVVPVDAIGSVAVVPVVGAAEEPVVVD